MTDVTARHWEWTEGLLYQQGLPRELLLTEAEGYVELKYHPKLVHEGKVLMPAGLYFARTQKPLCAETPKLFVFPPPYHVVEVMMANRGWGGTYGDGKFTIEAYGAIGRFRSTPYEIAKGEASKLVRDPMDYLYDNIDYLYDLFTPRSTSTPCDALSVFWCLGFDRNLPEYILKENQP